MIGISTGCFFKILENRNDSIEMIKGIADGIELVLCEPRDVIEFDINPKRLKGFEYISIHSPMKGISYRADLKTQGFLKKLNEISKSINAKNITFHTKDLVDANSITGYDFNACIENDGHIYDSVPYVKKLLQKHNKLMFTFDFAHAFPSCRHSRVYSSIIETVTNYKERIKEIHMSILNYHGRHDFIHPKEIDKELKDYLCFIKNLDKPIIIESTIQKEEDAHLLFKEIEFIKSL